MAMQVSGAGDSESIAFVNCDGSAAHPMVQAGTRREVVVNGQRVRTIDVHAHCSVPQAAALLGIDSPFISNPPAVLLGQSAVAARLEAMDRLGLDMAALSINPFWHHAERDLVGQVIAMQNEQLAKVCAAHPDRFVAFATVALQYPELAAEQLEHAVKQLGLRGAMVGCNVEGEELSSPPRLHPFWAKAEALGATVLIHPQMGPELAPGRLPGMLASVIGFPLDTTIALSHLIFDGTLDRFPRLKLCACHGGGYLPSYFGRSDVGYTRNPGQFPVRLKKKPTDYLRQMYFDALVMTTEGLRHLAAEVGASQIVMGTDFPFPTPDNLWITDPIEHILSTPGLSDADRIAILGGTAAKLLDISGNGK